MQQERQNPYDDSPGKTGSAKTGWENAGSAEDISRSTTEEVREKASEVATEVKDRAQKTAEKTREGTAEGMQSAAETIRERTEGSGGFQEQAGTKVADGMERTAQYLREHDTQEMVQDVERFVREHPTQAVVGAVAIGFVIGRILR